MPRTPDQGGTPEVQTNEQKFEAAFGTPPQRFLHNKLSKG